VLTGGVLYGHLLDYVAPSGESLRDARSLATQCIYYVTMSQQAYDDHGAAICQPAASDAVLPGHSE